MKTETKRTLPGLPWDNPCGTIRRDSTNPTGFIIETGLNPGQHPRQIFIKGDPTSDDDCDLVVGIVEACTNYDRVKAERDELAAALKRAEAHLRFLSIAISRTV